MKTKNDKYVNGSEKPGRIFARLLAKPVRDNDLGQVRGGGADAGEYSTWTMCTVWDGTCGIDDIGS